jgi:hypothetical protein
MTTYYWSSTTPETIRESIIEASNHPIYEKQNTDFCQWFDDSDGTWGVQKVRLAVVLVAPADWPSQSIVSRHQVRQEQGSNFGVERT